MSIDETNRKLVQDVNSILVELNRALEFGGIVDLTGYSVRIIETILKTQLDELTSAKRSEQ